MSAPPMILRVPLNISGNKVTPGGVPVFGRPGSTAKALDKSKAHLKQVKLQLKIANLNYKKSPSAINLKKIEAMKARVGGLKQIVKKQAKGAVAEAKNKLKFLRRKIKETRARLKSAAGKAKRPIQARLDGLINKVFSFRIAHMTNILKKNRSNLTAMRRSRLRMRDKIKALVAKIKRLTIPNPLLNMERVKMNTSLKKIRLNMTKSLSRQKKIIKNLNKLKAKKNVYNSRRNLQKATAGAMGSIPQAIKSIRSVLKRHSKILRRLTGGRRRPKKCGNMKLAQRRLKLVVGMIVKLKKTRASPARNKRLAKLRSLAKKRRIAIKRIIKCKSGRSKKKKCGNMKLAQRRLKRVVGMIVKLKKTRASPARDKRLAKLRSLAKKRRIAIKRILKCKGVIKCGNLRKAKRNLAKSRKLFALANKKAIARPSDEGAQRARKKFRARIKIHKKVIKKIWGCICRRAVKKYRQYKKLYARKKSSVYLRKMKIHKRMIKRCNCRKARINFNRAKGRFRKSQKQYLQNPKDTKAKDNITLFYKRMIVHRIKLKKLGCKLPVMPPAPSGISKSKFILKKKR